MPRTPPPQQNSRQRRSTRAFGPRFQPPQSQTASYGPVYMYKARYKLLNYYYYYIETPMPVELPSSWPI